ncbi:MAG: 50S ribosomal protein L11 methyltransferase [Candidatus Aquicultor sp.]
MNWLKVEVLVHPEAVEVLSAAMLDLSPSGIQLDEQGRNTLVTAYIPDSSFIDDARLTVQGALLAAASHGLQTGPGLITVTSITDEDWVENYKKHFKPIRIGRFLIKPSWETIEASPGELVIQLDPGLAFGTGSHPTTEGCLIFLQEFMSGGETVFDLGTGSGILSIAAAKLGAKRVISVDSDPQAITVAGENAQLNGVADVIEFAVADFAAMSPISADLMVANLTAPLIIDFLEDIPDKVQGLKVFIASGITVEQRAGVIRALGKAGFTVEEILTKGEWISLVSKLV